MQTDKEEYIAYMGGWNDALTILLMTERGLTLPEIRKHYPDSREWDKQPMFKHLKTFIKLIRKERKKDAKTTDNQPID